MPARAADPSAMPEAASAPADEVEEVDDLVTPKEKVNLRSIPSVDNPDSKVVATITSKDTVKRTGINRDVGWSRVEYNGQTLYCVTRYLNEAK